MCGLTDVSYHVQHMNQFSLRSSAAILYRDQSNTRCQGPGAIVSDWNNALKTGFDVERLEWPGWLLDSKLGGEIRHCLPEARNKLAKNLPTIFSEEEACQESSKNLLGGRGIRRKALGVLGELELRHRLLLLAG